MAALGCRLLVCSMNLFGQATAVAGLQGTIVDKTHATVTGASVTVTNKATGETRTTKADASGEYRFTFLPAGIYNLRVSAPSFSTAEARDVELLVGNTSTQNFTLSPGAVNETVEVTAVAPLVDHEKTDVGLTITPEQVQELPLNGRDFGNLAYLAPGAKPVDSYDPTKNRISIFGINGSSGRNVNVTVNGVDNKDNTVGGPVMQFPLESIQEFVISTQRFSAVNGRSEGAAVNVVTKSGGTDFHGSVFYQLRDKKLNATEVDPGTRLPVAQKPP